MYYSEITGLNLLPPFYKSEITILKLTGPKLQVLTRKLELMNTNLQVGIYKSQVTNPDFQNFSFILCRKCSASPTSRLWISAARRCCSVSILSASTSTTRATSSPPRSPSLGPRSRRSRTTRTSSRWGPCCIKIVFGQCKIKTMSRLFKLLSRFTNKDSMQNQLGQGIRKSCQLDRT